MRIKSGDQLSVTRGLDRNMEVIRSHVMTIEVTKQFPDRTLSREIRGVG